MGERYIKRAKLYFFMNCFRLLDTMVAASPPPGFRWLCV